MRRSKWLQSITVLSALTVVACGKDASPVSPTASSALLSGDALAAKGGNGGGNSGGSNSNGNAGQGNSNQSGNGGNGNGNSGNGGNSGNSGSSGNSGNSGNAGNNGPGNGSGAPGAPNPGQSKVELEGLITNIAGASITVDVDVVNVPATTIIRHGSFPVLFSQLQIGDRVHVKASVVGTTLDATEIDLQSSAGAAPWLNPGGAPGGGAATVQVTVLDAVASEAGPDAGTFELVRTPTAALPVTSPLTVAFTLTGTASNGVDYVNVPLTATFLAGQTLADVVVTPIPDGTIETLEDVVLTLTNAAPYVIGAPSSGTVTITELPVVSVTASDPTAVETGLNPGMFHFVRSGSVAAPLTVTYTVGGTALNGTDYQVLPLSVTFLAGFATADVVLTPLLDGLIEGSETVDVTVSSGVLYAVGSPALATVTISD